MADTTFGRLLQCNRHHRPFLPPPVSFRTSERDRAERMLVGRMPLYLSTQAFADYVGLPHWMVQGYVEQGAITVLPGELADIRIPVQQGVRDLKKLWRPAKTPKARAA